MLGNIQEHMVLENVCYPWEIQILYIVAQRVLVAVQSQILKKVTGILSNESNVGKRCINCYGNNNQEDWGCTKIN